MSTHKSDNWTQKNVYQIILDKAEKKLISKHKKKKNNIEQEPDGFGTQKNNYNQENH